jgi:hypothetical protein
MRYLLLEHLKKNQAMLIRHRTRRFLERKAGSLKPRSSTNRSSSNRDQAQSMTAVLLRGEAGSETGVRLLARVREVFLCGAGRRDLV